MKKILILRAEVEQVERKVCREAVAVALEASSRSLKPSKSGAASR